MASDLRPQLFWHYSLASLPRAAQLPGSLSWWRCPGERCQELRFCLPRQDAEHYHGQRAGHRKDLQCARHSGLQQWPEADVYHRWVSTPGSLWLLQLRVPLLHFIQWCLDKWGYGWTADFWKVSRLTETGFSLFFTLHYSLWASWIPQRLLTFSIHKALSCWVCSGRRSTPNSAAPDLFLFMSGPLPTLLFPKPGKGGLGRKGCVFESQPRLQSRLLTGHQVKMRVLFQIWISFSESFEIISSLQENYKDG